MPIRLLEARLAAARGVPQALSLPLGPGVVDVRRSGVPGLAADAAVA